MGCPAVRDGSGCAGRRYGKPRCATLSKHLPAASSSGADECRAIRLRYMKEAKCARPTQSPPKACPWGTVRLQLRHRAICLMTWLMPGVGRLVRGPCQRFPCRRSRPRDSRRGRVPWIRRIAMTDSVMFASARALRRMARTLRRARERRFWNHAAAVAGVLVRRDFRPRWK